MGRRRKVFSDPFLRGSPSVFATRGQHRGVMRRPRLELPGMPLHITHRGVNRGATFIDDEDFATYLQALEHTASEQGVALHGYVLMTNHVHLLVSAQAGGVVSRMMQALGRRYVRAFNAETVPGTIPRGIAGQETVPGTIPWVMTELSGRIGGEF